MKKHITAPKTYKPQGKPREWLAYLNEEEMDLLMELGRRRKPHRGPKDLPSFPPAGDAKAGHTNSAGGSIGGSSNSNSGTGARGPTNNAGNASHTSGSGAAGSSTRTSNAGGNMGGQKASNNNTGTGARGPTNNAGNPSQTGSKGANVSGFGSNTTSVNKNPGATKASAPTGARGPLGPGGEATKTPVSSQPSKNPGTRAMGYSDMVKPEVGLRGPLGLDGSFTNEDQFDGPIHRQSFQLNDVANRVSKATGKPVSREQANEIARTLAGEAINQSDEQQAAAARTMTNRMRLGMSVDQMLTGYDANGLRKGTKQNSVYKNAVPGSASVDAGIAAMANELSPSSPYGVHAPQQVQDATHYLTKTLDNQLANNARHWSNTPSFEATKTAYGDHVFGNSEPTATQVAMARAQEGATVQPASVQGPTKIQDRVPQDPKQITDRLFGDGDQTRSIPQNVYDDPRIAGQNYTNPAKFTAPAAPPPGRDWRDVAPPGPANMDDAIFPGGNSTYALPDQPAGMGGIPDSGVRKSVPGSYPNMPEPANLPAQGQPYGYKIPGAAPKTTSPVVRSDGPPRGALSPGTVVGVEPTGFDRVREPYDFDEMDQMRQDAENFGRLARTQEYNNLLNSGEDEAPAFDASKYPTPRRDAANFNRFAVAMHPDQFSASYGPVGEPIPGVDDIYSGPETVEGKYKKPIGPVKGGAVQKNVIRAGLGALGVATGTPTTLLTKPVNYLTDVMRNKPALPGQNARSYAARYAERNVGGSDGRGTGLYPGQGGLASLGRPSTGGGLGSPVVGGGGTGTPGTGGGTGTPGTGTGGTGAPVGGGWDVTRNPNPINYATYGQGPEWEYYDYNYI